VRFAELHLTNFRSYGEASLSLPDEPGCVAFLGPNGAGKTNVIEALSILSLTRSCRGNDEAEVVKWDAPFYRLKAAVTADDGTRKTVEVVSELTPRKRKALFVNDIKTSASDFVGLVPTVTFLPQDLLLFSGPPAERRRFLDQLLSQVSPEYLTALSQYQQVLQQRNALLKTLAQTNGDQDVLSVWDREAAKFGSMVTLRRLELMETLMLTFAEELSRLGETWNDVKLRYERKTTARDATELEEEAFRVLKAGRDRDILLQGTTSGPHREDWQIGVEGRDLPAFASRGQERTAVLALLFLQVSYLQLKRGEMPVLLLDDACSELDERHQEALLSGFPGAQVFLTATRLPDQAWPLKTFVVEPGSAIVEPT
jgi:DNA replication and repair protein RecF